MFGMKYRNLIFIAALFPVIMNAQQPELTFEPGPRKTNYRTSEVEVVSSVTKKDQFDVSLYPGSKDETVVKLTVYLEGPFSGSKMNTDLNKAGLIPLSQPYNMPPWNYPGTESVPAIPSENVVDWILIDVRSADSAGAADSSTTFARKTGFLMNNGQIFNLDGSSLLSFDTVFS
jgi:hypothetical protein